MRYPVSLLFLIVLLTSCTREMLPSSPHGSYLAALIREDLDSSARRWAADATATLQTPLPIEMPYSERRLLENEHLQPVTFAVSLREEQLLQVDIVPSTNTRADVFVDVFAADENAGIPERVASMASDKRVLTFEARRDGNYLVRIHPSRTAVGLIDIAITTPYKFGFPVDIDRDNAVQSYFGAPRDAGARSHEGIDIFASRGTPVVAAADGRVTKVADTAMGGKQVWVRNRRYAFYYAHLDSTAVAKGDEVKRGQVLGTVGNTGNASATSPHLHFGIYQRWQGAIDPLPLVGPSKNAAMFSTPEVALAPRWLSVTASKLNLRTGPSLRTPVTDALARGDLIRVDAVAGNWLRITTGSGRMGFVARRLTHLPVESDLLLDRDSLVASRPKKDAPIIGHFSSGQQLPALGRFGDFTLVKMPGGLYGWASASDVNRELSSLN